MPEWIKWVFEGIGTEIIAAIIGLIVGGVGGFTIGKHTKSKQKQTAGDYSTQKQSLSDDNGVAVNSKRINETSSIVQEQKAGNNSEQIQIGSIKHGRR